MNISFIGMPASGKTTIAKALRKVLKNYALIDTDEKIIEAENRSINEIFKTEGESYFRKIETDILKKILQNDNQIISTGGGIVKKEENIILLKEKSVIIYIETDIKTLLQRAKEDKTRPLLNVNNKREELKKLLKEREENYKKADFIVQTKGKSPDRAAKEIMEVLNENCGS